MNQALKAQFLGKINAINKGKSDVKTHQDAQREAILSALRTRGKKIYKPNVSVEEATDFREALAKKLSSSAELYRNGVTRESHAKMIERISYELSRDFKDILDNGRFRIGIAQKALNLYLKFLWCLYPDWPTPPDCPIDGGVLEAAGVIGSWTQLDSIETYKQWIERIEQVAQSRHLSVAEWELSDWNSR